MGRGMSGWEQPVWGRSHGWRRLVSRASGWQELLNLVHEWPSMLWREWEALKIYKGPLAKENYRRGTEGR